MAGRRWEFLRIDRDDVARYLAEGWSVVRGAETYNGDRWAVLVYREAPGAAESLRDDRHGGPE